MHVDSHDAKVRQRRRQLECMNSLRRINAEFIFRQSCGNVRVRLRVDVRVDADANGSFDVQFARDGVDEMQLLQRFRFEHDDGVLQYSADLFLSFSHAGKNYPMRVDAGLHCAEKFSAGITINTAPRIIENPADV